MIWYGLAGYLAIGALIVLFGPGRREIAKHVAQARGTSFTRALLEQPEVPEWKLVVFRVLLTIVVVLLWPLLLWSALQQKRQSDAWNREYEARVAQGLEFSRMGGAGVISCQDCGFRQKITSFMHGATSGPDACCDEGLQCLSCGKFVSVHREGNPPSMTEFTAAGGSRIPANRVQDFGTTASVQGLSGFLCARHIMTTNRSQYAKQAQAALRGEACP